MEENNEVHTYSDDNITSSTKCGVFWLIEDRLFAYPFCKELFPEGIAKSGNTYNHKKLWALLRISNKPFNYYPRGRVDVSDQDRVRIYLSPHIDIERWLPEIKLVFDINNRSCCVYADHSAHYRCYLDDDWQMSHEDNQAR